MLTTPYSNWSNQTGADCTRYQQAAPDNSMLYQTAAGCTRKKQAATERSRLHQAAAGCTRQRQAAPGSGRLHHIAAGCTRKQQVAAGCSRPGCSSYHLLTLMPVRKFPDKHPFNLLIQSFKLNVANHCRNTISK